MKIRSIILGSILSITAATSQAGSFSYSVTGTFTDSDPSLTLNVTTTAIAGFDSSLGTLTGITVEFSEMTVSASTTLLNTDINNESTVDSASIGYTGVGSSELPVLSGPGVSSLTFPLAGTIAVNLTGNSPIAADGSEVWSGGPTTSSAALATSQAISASDFGLFIDDPVFFDITGLAATSISFTGGSPVFTDSSLTGSGLITVTYTYIPEPSTALLGALGMLALLRRRR